MSVLDKFLNAMKLNDDDDSEDGGYLDDDVRDFGDEEEQGGRRVIRSRNDDDDDDDDVAPGSARRSASFTSGRSSMRESANRQREERAAEETDDTSSRNSSGGSRTRNSASSGSSKISPIRGRKTREGSGMEVCVIRPHSMEDAREITETLLSNCTVVLNLEGLELEIAQRIIDFASGSCYAMDGNLQKISSYIFIITPSTVEISGDFQDLVSGAFDVPFEKRY